MSKNSLFSDITMTPKLEIKIGYFINKTERDVLKKLHFLSRCLYSCSMKVELRYT